MTEPLFIQENVPLKVGMMSLVGVDLTAAAPYAFGNYFTLQCGSRVVNFWAENLKAANARFDLKDIVTIRRYKTAQYDYCLIDDFRIPSTWYSSRLCFTGARAGFPPDNVLEDMRRVHGCWRPDTPKQDIVGMQGPPIVTTVVTATPRQLKVNWTIDDDYPEGTPTKPKL